MIYGIESVFKVQIVLFFQQILAFETKTNVNVVWFLRISHIFIYKADAEC